MGYDMNWRRVDDSEREAVAAAGEVFNAAVKARDALPREESGRLNREKAEKIGDWDAHEAYDGRTQRWIEAQDAVNAAHEAMQDAEKSYFRLNIFGMSRYAELMFRLGMVFEDEPYPAWPELENYGVTDEQVAAVEHPEDYPKVFAAITPEVMGQVLAYHAEHDRVLSWHGKTDVPGIPLHKLGSNDGWIVLPVECEAAVRIWRDHVDKHGDADVRAALGGNSLDYWLKWITFLEGAATHDGFEVW